MGYGGYVAVGHLQGTQEKNMPDDNDFNVTSETLLQAARFRVDRMTQTFPDGRQFRKDVVQHLGLWLSCPFWLRSNLSDSQLSSRRGPMVV